MDKKALSVNLLRSEKGKLDIFLDWILSTGRILIIVTYLITLSALLYRFTLDWQISDLNSQITDKQNIVQALKKQEEEYRNLQQKIALLRTVDQMSDDKIIILKDIMTKATGRVIFDSLTLEGNRITLNAITSSSKLLADFIKSFREDNQKYHNISIERIENKISNGYILLTLSANVKGGIQDDGQ